MISLVKNAILTVAAFALVKYCAQRNDGMRKELMSRSKRFSSPEIQLWRLMFHGSFYTAIFFQLRADRSRLNENIRNFISFFVENNKTFITE